MPEVLGPLERRIMGHVWQSGPSTVAQARDALNEASSQQLAYTTVMTILVRLFEKGAATREPRGRAWAYRPVLDREEHAAERMNALLRNGGDRAVALARFVDNMTPKERAQLRRLLDSRRRTR